MSEPRAGGLVFLATDIVGSVDLWQRDEAGMSVALAHHDQLLRTIVARHGGRVVKGAGDGLWAVFAQPRGAFDAALAIQAEIRAAFRGSATELRVRIAIHAGQAEERDGDFFGQTPNRLARLMGRAGSGQILVSEAAILMAGAEAAAFALRSLGELRLRSLREPLSVFELRALNDTTATADDANSSESVFVAAHPFPAPGRLVGRDANVATLWAVLEHGRESGQVVVIRAPAGTGKSTVVGELGQRARAVGTLCLAGGAREQAGNAPFGPLRDALADYLLSLPDQRVRELLGEAAEDLASVMPELAYHLGLVRRNGDAPDFASVSGAVVACLYRLAQRHPMLLCLEDLHATDAGTISLIHAVARRMSRLPLVLCLTFRSDEVQPEHDLARLVTTLARDGATVIDLAPLDRTETGQLIASLLNGPASEHLRDSLYTSTEGNPLFLEQSVLALREEGRIGRTGRVWRGADDDPLSLPGIVRDVLDRRLRRLSRRCQATVAMAAILGPTFDFDLLSAALSPPTVLGLVEDLEEATAAQVVREVPAGYAFTHALLREVVYRSLSEPRRRLHHAAAGAALERVVGARTEDQASELAHHFVLAGHDPATIAKALAYSLMAGRRADALLLHREALEYMRRVYNLSEQHGVPCDLTTLLQVLEVCQRAERALGQWLPLVETCERILALTTDPLMRARALGSVGHAKQRTGDTIAAVQAYRDALTELDRVSDQTAATAPRIEILADNGYLLFLLGRFEEQESILASILPRARAEGSPRHLQVVLTGLALSNLGRGRIDKAVPLFEQAIAAAVDSNDRLEQALTYSNLGIQYQFAGEHAQARAQLERALQLRRDAGAEVRDVNTIQRLGWVALGEGNLEAASEYAELARELASRASDRWVADCHDLLGTICTLKAEWSGASDHFEQAMHLREQGPHVVGRIETLLGLGMLRQQTGDWPGARTAFARALGFASAIDPGPWLVAARRQLGRLLCLMGEPEGVELVRAALDLAETMPRSIEYGPSLLAAVESGCWGDDRAAAVHALVRALSSGLTAAVRIEVLCTLARYQIADGNLATAHQQIAAARTLAAGLDAPRVRCLTLHTEGEAARAAGDVEAALHAFEQALSIARAVGLPHEESGARIALTSIELTEDDMSPRGTLAAESLPDTQLARAPSAQS